METTKTRPRLPNTKPIGGMSKTMTMLTTISLVVIIFGMIIILNLAACGL